MLKVYSNQTVDVNKICQRVMRFSIVEATFAFDLVAFDLVAFIFGTIPANSLLYSVLPKSMEVL